MKIKMLFFILINIVFSANCFSNNLYNKSEIIKDNLGLEYSYIAYEYLTLYKDRNVFYDRTQINVEYAYKKFKTLYERQIDTNYEYYSLMIKHHPDEFKRMTTLLNKIKKTEKPCPNNNLTNQCLFSRSQFLDFNIQISNMILNHESKTIINQKFQSEKLEAEKFYLLRNMLIEQATRTKP